MTAKSGLFIYLFGSIFVRRASGAAGTEGEANALPIIIGAWDGVRAGPWAGYGRMSVTADNTFTGSG